MAGRLHFVSFRFTASWWIRGRLEENVIIVFIGVKNKKMGLNRHIVEKWTIFEN